MARDFYACLRILETPLPFVYVSHLRTFMVLWLCVLPWMFVANFEWWTMLLCLIVAYGVLGRSTARGPATARNPGWLDG
jgi:putative membrane protein